MTVTEDMARGRTARDSAARTYARALPVVPVRARGLTVEGADGRRYLDCLSGAGTLALGHNHPVVLEAIREVLDSGAPLHIAGLRTPVEEAFVAELLRTLPPALAPHARVRFCGPSRASALEEAGRLVRAATGRTEVRDLDAMRPPHTTLLPDGDREGGPAPRAEADAAADGGPSFARHVRTEECASCALPDGQGGRDASGVRSDPGGPGAPYPAKSDALRDVRQARDAPDAPGPADGPGRAGGCGTGTGRGQACGGHDEEGHTGGGGHGGGGGLAGAVVAGVRGADGTTPTCDDWTREVRRLTRGLGVPLIADESETGVGRTGAFWAVEHSGITPDVMILSKAIGGSLPLPLVVHHADLDPGTSADTLRGNQLAMAAGTATLRHVRENRLAERAASLGHRLLGQLRDLAGKFPCVRGVRGRGLMTGIEFRSPGADAHADPGPRPGASSHSGARWNPGTRRSSARELAAAVQHECLRRGLIVGLSGRDSHVVRLLPPLTISDEQASAVIERLCEAVETVALGDPPPVLVPPPPC